MIKNNKRNSRDDKSKPGKSSTSRKPKAATEDKPKSRFGEKDDKEPKRKATFATGEKTYKDFKTRSAKDNDSRPAAGKDFKPRTEGAQKDGFKPWEKKEGNTRNSGDSEKRSYVKKDGFKPWEKKEENTRNSADGEKRSYVKKDNKYSAEGAKPSFGDRKEGAKPNFKSRPFKEGSSRDSSEGEKRSYVKKDNKYSTESSETRFGDKKTSTSRSTDSRPYRKREDGDFKSSKDRGERVAPSTRSRKTVEPKDDGLIRLNRYIANSGICSRRKADELIEAGVVSVNGVPISELGHKVDPYKDEVRYNGELLKREKRVYVLLNKPKDYITTTEDPQERRTVMHLVEKASRERIYPVGRLDRNTTGLLLMTNDGELADKLSHPKNGITKIYHVELSRNLSQGDFNKIQFGLELEDGLIKPDNISYVTGASKREVGIQIHSGKNRIVRRIFEHLGYDVIKLDRVVYGNLTKKDLPRGKWRFLEEHELIQIKHLIK